MKRSEAFPTKYLSKDDIQQPTAGVIAHVANETLGQGQDQEVKPVISFTGDNLKPMVCNGTNWDILESLYGDDSDNWIGKRVEIWVDPNVMFGGKRTGGLRFRAPKASNGNNGVTQSYAARYQELVAEATGLGLVFPTLDPAAGDADIIAAGKALKAKIAEAQAEAF
jgi:hypothetical protein